MLRKHFYCNLPFPYIRLLCYSMFLAMNKTYFIKSHKDLYKMWNKRKKHRIYNRLLSNCFRLVIKPKQNVRFVQSQQSLIKIKSTKFPLEKITLVFRFLYPLGNESETLKSKMVFTFPRHFCMQCDFFSSCISERQLLELLERVKGVESNPLKIWTEVLCLIGRHDSFRLQQWEFCIIFDWGKRPLFDIFFSRL